MLVYAVWLIYVGASVYMLRNYALPAGVKVVEYWRQEHQRGFCRTLAMLSRITLIVLSLFIFWRGIHIFNQALSLTETYRDMLLLIVAKWCIPFMILMGGIFREKY